MKLLELVSDLDKFLETPRYEDISLNGLQVEASSDVKKIAVAVDSSLSTFEQAAQLGADLLIVHHGLFWGKSQPLRGILGKRVRFLYEHGVSLYASHLPLDAHHEVGNNWGLARLLGLQDLQPFGSWGKEAIGVKGSFAAPLALRDLANKIEEQLGEAVLVHAGGKAEVASLGIITGAAARELNRAADEGLDAFLTGEPKHDVFYDAFEREINALYAGHYMTETVGVKLLGAWISEHYQLPYEFILLPTGL